MFKFRLAYRHHNGDVEGFIGIGFTEDAALRDCREQMVRKLRHVYFDDATKAVIDESRIVDDRSQLSDSEYRTVQTDWDSNLRY